VNANLGIASTLSQELGGRAQHTHLFGHRRSDELVERYAPFSR
jgi:hypothetical protein